MSNKKLSLSGMPDFSSLEVKRRDYLFSIIKNIFNKYGFSPLETPSMEKRETLLGKYGKEGDKLIYQILRSGDFTSKLDKKDMEELDYKKLSNLISDKALRYDLTIPFARYVVENSSNISFPFKRYQIQKVWRADRPQKGRLREFTQCDADIIGSDSLWLESDLIKIYDDFFYEIGLKDIILKWNNRKILEGVYNDLSLNCSFSEFCISLDKIEKTGKENFLDFIQNNGSTKKGIDLLNFFLDEFNSTSSFDILLSKFNESKKNSLLDQGLSEASELFLKINSLKELKIEFDFSLARGLDYYTGMIFEVKSEKINIGSLGGGGRYDNLTSLFGKNIGSGVGLSLGVDRILICLDELDLFPKKLESSIDVLFVNLGEKEASLSQTYIDKLRKNNISAELFPDTLKLKKQMSYANKRGVKYTALLGEEEIASKTIKVRNMIDGSQDYLSLLELIKKLKNE